jgi:hypothetical protein
MLGSSSVMNCNMNESYRVISHTGRYLTPFAPALRRRSVSAVNAVLSMQIL